LVKARRGGKISRTAHRGDADLDRDRSRFLVSAAVFRVPIAAFSDEDRADAFELAERRYAQAARDFGCDEAETKRWVTALMRKLRALVIEADSATPTDLGGATATS
jgi:hypothetical protein